MMTCCAFVAVLLLMLPDPAWAWGPITHLAHGAEVYQNLTILGVTLQRLLRRHRLEYLYGCLGPDMIQAKKFTRAEQAHCHSWEVGWAIMRAARGVKQRAFAYGYLTHLASDVFSHNHYVPMQLVTSFRAPGMRHIYWEVHFDTLQALQYREVLSEVRNHSFPECDALVEEVVGRTLFSFQTDKRIFDSFVAIQDMNQWQRLMSGFAARSPYQLPEGTVEEYNTACLTSIIDLLQRGKRSACQQDDPIGLDALREARQTRRNLQLLVRNSSAPAQVLQTVQRLRTAHPLPCAATPT